MHPSTLEALAHVAWPVRPADDLFERSLARFRTTLALQGRRAIASYHALLALLEQAARFGHGGRAFSQLEGGEAERFLAGWLDGNLAERRIVHALIEPLKAAFAAESSTAREEDDLEAINDDAILAGADIGEDELACDVVVAGSGAGGAVAAGELAAQGFSVVLLEAGENLEARESSVGAHESFPPWGNASIRITAGRRVGGSTAFGARHLWIPPDWLLDRWAGDGLVHLAAGRMAPYFERVARRMHAESPPASALDRALARGCDAIGYLRQPLAEDDVGARLPRPVRRGLAHAYLDRALRHGARVITGTQVEHVLLEGDRAVGLTATVIKSGRALRVRAHASILACGALATPSLLAHQGVRLGHLGRNLALHPTASVGALLPRALESGALAGCHVDHLERQGIVIVPAPQRWELDPRQVRVFGSRLEEAMEASDRLASIGVMVEDQASGRVLPSRSRQPLVLYWLGRRERERLLRGCEMVARILLAAGAQEVMPPLTGLSELRSSSDVESLASSHPAAKQWLLHSHAPVGTCRMARSPRLGVVSPAHEVFGIERLYVVDGSVLPSALPASPQATIMALALRAAERIGLRLEGTRRPPPAPHPREVDSPTSSAPPPAPTSPSSETTVAPL